jgi:hypothetical protein
VPNARAFNCGDACVVIGDPTAAPIRVHALLSGLDNPEPVRVALEAVAARYPGRELFAPPIWPEDYSATVFEPLGFVREPITQFLMRRDL